MATVKSKLLFLFLITLLPLLSRAQINDGAVIPGDFADPSIIKVGNVYYAAGTSSEWAPHFPIYRSTDLKKWVQVGYVFDKMPEWAMGSFWAPEYYKIGDTYYIYYTARRKSDHTSFIGVATSKYPDKGFVDHGVLIEHGKEAIDAFVYNDNGQRYITFKAYGLDDRPIELLAYKLSADGLKLDGSPFSLLRDDQKIGMEGQSFLKHDGYYYLFYSAGGCCGVGCSYNVRVARAKNFAGPYEVYGKNPILSENDKWKCMGHGTFVKAPDGKDLYLHHGYHKNSVAMTGRQGLVSELSWNGNNGWPTFRPQTVAGAAAPNIVDDFKAKKLADGWQWDMRNATPKYKLSNGVLTLSGTAKESNNTGIVLTHRPVSSDLEMTATVLNNNNALKGLSFYGDANAAVGIGTQDEKIIVWQVVDNKFMVLGQADAPGRSPLELKLRLAGKTCTFYYKQKDKAWQQLLTETPVDASRLPQWDRSPRLGLHFKGDPAISGKFSNFAIINK